MEINAGRWTAALDGDFVDFLIGYARFPSARHAPVWRAWNRLADGEVAVDEGTGSARLRLGG